MMRLPTHPEPAPVITRGSRVRVHLSIHLEDGTLALSSFDDEPLEWRIGDGSLAPGLEDLLLGLAPGADEQVLATGDAVFGAPDPGLIQIIAPADLPAGFQAAPGTVVAFAAPGGQETAGTVLAQTAAGLEVDFNPPLARRNLRIRLQVLAVGAPDRPLTTASAG
ncbi:MAG: peptidylprolyl isomerase [Chromatiaceae bacterium]|nr:MAG: peptidylprolyl isomerase [Chromatiaceae bacterium]